MRPPTDAWSDQLHPAHPVGRGTVDGGPPRHSRDRWLFRLAVALGVLPFLVTAVALLLGDGGDYRPAGDVAMIEMHVQDVGRHEVLVGLHSRPSWSHPGPMLFYVLAPMHRLVGGSMGMVIGALTINAGAVVGILALASCALLSVLWPGPLIDVVRNSPSNVGEIYTWFADPPVDAHTVIDG